MLHRWTEALTGVWIRLVSGPSRLNRAVRQSLNPATEGDAQILEAQLELVRTNVRLLDFAFPLVGVMLILLHAGHSSVSGPLAAWAVLAVAVAANEIVLLCRPARRDDTIARVRENAKAIPFAMFCL